MRVACNLLVYVHNSTANKKQPHPVSTECGCLFSIVPPFYFERSSPETEANPDTSLNVPSPSRVR